MSIFGDHDTGNARDSDVVLLVMGIEMGMQMQMQMSCSMLRLMLQQATGSSIGEKIDARHVGTLTPLELSRLIKKWIEWS